MASLFCVLLKSSHKYEPSAASASHVSACRKTTMWYSFSSPVGGQRSRSVSCSRTLLEYRDLETWTFLLKEIWSHSPRVKSRLLQHRHPSCFVLEIISQHGTDIAKEALLMIYIIYLHVVFFNFQWESSFTKDSFQLKHWITRCVKLTGTQSSNE